MAKKQKRKIYVADAETDPFKYGVEIKPFLWGLMNVETQEFEHFTDTSAFSDRIKKEQCIIYGHNAGKFDWHFLFDNFEAGQKFLVINGRIAQAGFGLSELRDSYCIFPFSLATYQKKEIDYAKFTKRNRKRYHSEILEYLKSDCINLCDLLKPFIDEYGANITLAGTAYKIWKKLEGIDCSTDIKHDSLFREYYFGGRVDALFQGELPKGIKSYDINSAYPYAMLFDHPFGNVIIEPELLSELSKHEIERAFITLDAQSFGAFPFRTKTDLLFPDDGKIREFKVTGWEYLMAKKYKKLGKHEIKYIVTLGDKINFKRYVNKFYKMKQDAEASGDKNTRLYAKILLNALYGKFSSNYRDYKQNVLVNPSEINNYIFAGWQPCNELGNLYLMERDLRPEEMYFKNVAVGASITGFQRARLFEATLITKGPVYIDTDCIKCRDGSQLDIGNELGQWKLEAEYGQGAIIGKKVYAFKYSAKWFKELMAKWVSKGKKLKDKPKQWVYAAKGIKTTPAQIMKLAKGVIKSINFKSESPTFTLKRGKYYLERNLKKVDKQRNPD